MLMDMHAGNIAKWNKKEGDEIAAGDSIAEIETDKATMDWEAQDDGFVAKILAEEGSKDVSVGAPVIVIVEEEVIIHLQSAYANEFQTLKGTFIFATRTMAYLCMCKSLQIKCVCRTYGDKNLREDL